MKQSRFQVYQGLSTTDLERMNAYFPTNLLSMAEIKEYKNNEYITQATKSLEQLFFIIKGKAKIYVTHENGKKILLQFLTTGDLIGELTVVGAESTPKDVVAIGNTICLAVPMKIAQKEEGIFLKKIARYIGEKLLFRAEHFSRNQSYELKYRLAEIILQVEIDGIYHEKHIEMAEYLGVSYRHYTHTLKKLTEEGYLRKQHREYFVNRPQLKKLVSCHAS
ncbi:transcriptional regulator YeiL [Isobaculum melis]|uniref:cAMP-binding domain of CRP or a regulatory subunit of cAMP-dependent protein kinases n=1 Tax=Isobaculum melis TaxID=142588 RepID=A0A1H9SBG4_9LACT|nr:transcriptional regulator YeiL [Isobaculum melis]SER82360.1 cAMP-binding domain of CRP or a regulatory subunit of cAMP-dependent protein kinases [Isobaculum melis]